MLRAISFLLLIFSLTACGYFGDNAQLFAPEITGFMDTQEGLVVSFSANGDGPVVYSGVEYRQPGEVFTYRNQTLQEGDGGGSVVVRNLPNGPQDFRVFVAGENGTYAYSEPQQHNVNAAAPDIPCSPALGTIMGNTSALSCPGSDWVARESRDNAPGGTFEIEVTCFSNNTRLLFLFPRIPTSGVYTTNGLFNDLNRNQPTSLSLYAFVNGSGRMFERDIPVYVTTTTDHITLTICDAPFPTTNLSPTFSGSVRLDL